MKPQTIRRILSGAYSRPFAPSIRAFDPRADDAAMMAAMDVLGVKPAPRECCHLDYPHMLDVPPPHGDACITVFGRPIGREGDLGYWPEFARGPRKLREALLRLWRARVDVPVMNGRNDAENAAGWAAVDKAWAAWCTVAPSCLVQTAMTGDAS